MNFIELSKVAVMGGVVTHSTPVVINKAHIVSFHENKNEVTLVHLVDGAKLMVSERASTVKEMVNS